MIRNQNYTTKISEHMKNEWNFFLLMELDNIVNTTLFIPYLYDVFINTDSMYCHLQPFVSTIFNYSWTCNEQIHKKQLKNIV